MALDQLELTERILLTRPFRIHTPKLVYDVRKRPVVKSLEPLNPERSRLPLSVRVADAPCNALHEKRRAEDVRRDVSCEVPRRLAEVNVLFILQMTGTGSLVPPTTNDDPVQLFELGEDILRSGRSVPADETQYRCEPGVMNFVQISRSLSCFLFIPG